MQQCLYFINNDLHNYIYKRSGSWPWHLAHQPNKHISLSAYNYLAHQPISKITIQKGLDLGVLHISLRGSFSTRLSISRLLAIEFCTHSYIHELGGRWGVLNC
jgi:hypothetical protein